MCIHYTVPAELPDTFFAEYTFRPNASEHYAKLAKELGDKGAWPLYQVPAVRLDDTGELEVFGAEWGLLPRWWKPSDKTPKRASFQRKTVNARSETAAEKPTFRDALKRRRCVLPVAEFEEKKHYFGLGEPMAFAGLWESWLGEDGEVATVTLLTTEPNAEVRAVGHHRMPCLLASPQSRREWLMGEGDERLLDSFANGVLSSRVK